MADKASDLFCILAARRSELELDQNEWDQLMVYLDAFRVFIEREAKYHSLWKEYGAKDTAHHVKSKGLRLKTQVEADGLEADYDDAFDLINYAAFTVRNIRGGRLG